MSKDTGEIKFLKTRYACSSCGEAFDDKGAFIAHITNTVDSKACMVDVVRRAEFTALKADLATVAQAILKLRGAYTILELKLELTRIASEGKP